MKSRTVGRLAADAYDGPWKNALDAFLPSMMEMLFPATFAAIDWSRPVVPLNSELHHLVPAEEHAPGRRADALYSGGAPRRRRLVDHRARGDPVPPDPALARRMFVYAYRAFEKYDLEVFGFAVLGDLKPDLPVRAPMSGSSPANTGWSTTSRWPSCSTSATGRPSSRRSENPFAMVILAHLYTKWTHGDQDRRRSFKLRLARLLFQRQFSREQIHQLFRIIDWMMRLGPEQDIIFRREVLALKENPAWPLTSTHSKGSPASKPLQEGEHDGAMRILRSPVDPPLRRPALLGCREAEGGKRSYHRGLVAALARRPLRRRNFRLRPNYHSSDREHAAVEIVDLGAVAFEHHRPADFEGGGQPRRFRP